MRFIFGYLYAIGILSVTIPMMYYVNLEYLGITEGFSNLE